jgi:chromatin remodeling complex protein RSC6
MSTHSSTNTKKAQNKTAETKVAEPVVKVADETIKIDLKNTPKKETKAKTDKIVEVNMEEVDEKKTKRGRKAKTEDVESEATPSVAGDSEAETNESHEETFENYDAVAKAVADIDKDIIKLNRRRAQLTKIQNKLYAKETRQLKKKTKNSGEKTLRKQSGFNKATKVPMAFCEYLGLSQDEEVPRTHITSLLYKKIKEMGMLNPEDKREINPDDELRKLLMMKSDEEIRFQNVQHYVARVYKAEFGTVQAIGNNTVAVSVNGVKADDDEEEELELVEDDEDAEEDEEEELDE